MDLQACYTSLREHTLAAVHRDDEDRERSRVDMEQLRVWWPLSTASRIMGRSLFEELQSYRTEVCHGQMQKGLRACDELQRILQCFKIASPAGKAPMLVDSGSTCFLSPMHQHIVVRFKCTTDITGVGQSTAKHYSPCVLGGVDVDGQYQVIYHSRIYELSSLDFPIMSTPALERQGYEFQLNSSFSRMSTPEGKIVPLIRDPGTGFHFMVDHMNAEPVLERKRMIVEAALQQPQTALFEPVDMVDRFDASKAEARPTGPDSADGLNEFLSVNFGAEFAWPSQKGAENVRKEPVAGASGGAASRLHSFETGRVVWAKLGKHWWPARISSMKDVPD